MKITDGLVVSLHLELTDPAGQLIESTTGKDPIVFTFGSRNVLPGIAEAIVGMSAGESKSGHIPPGALVPLASLPKRHIPRAELPQGAAPQIGDRFQAKVSEGQPALQLEIIAVDERGLDTVVLHPLSLVEVKYSLTVVAVRKLNLPPPPPADDAEELTDAQLIED